jgi:zinc/manganese transport system substrate-binding protein
MRTWTVFIDRLLSINLHKVGVEVRARKFKGLLAVSAVLALVSFCGACSTGQGDLDDAGSKLDVVATTTQNGDFVRNVGGDAVDLHQILQPNSDPHDYEPRPEDVEETAGAELVFVNGDNLDDWIDEVVAQSGGDPRVVDLGKNVPVKLPGESKGEEASRYDPHWWHDPRNAEAAVEQIRDVLIEADPNHREVYKRNAEAYIARIDELDYTIRACVDEVPPEERKLVTDHDAFGYFAKRYDIDVVGAVIPSQSTQAQPSAGETARLISLIRRENVRAVFPESSINPKLAETIARETGASADYTLYGDTLGPKGSNGDTYVRMEAANANAMVEGFTGGQESCDLASGQ